MDSPFCFPVKNGGIVQLLFTRRRRINQSGALSVSLYLGTHQPLTPEIATDSIICFWNTRKIISIGKSAIIEAAMISG
ncbi:hypothetical protein D3C81_1865630 [compost metagenome]